MVIIYLLTREQMRDGIIAYEPLRFYISRKKAGLAFRRQCRKSSGGRLEKEWVWQSDQERICVKRSRLRTERIPKKVYVSRKITYVDGRKVMLDIVSLEREEGVWEETFCGEWEKTWLETACTYLPFFLVTLLLFFSILKAGQEAALVLLLLSSILPGYLIGYVLYLIHGHHAERKLNYRRHEP